MALVSSNELHLIRRLSEQLVKFKRTYIVYNRQLNSIFKIAEEIGGIYVGNNNALGSGNIGDSAGGTKTDREHKGNGSK